MRKTIVLSGLAFCTILFFSCRTARNFIALLMVPVGDQGINIVTIELAILRNPNNVTAYYNRAVLYSQGVDYDAAIDDLTKVVSLNSERNNQRLNADVYVKRGDIYQKVGSREMAIADYHKAANLYQEQGEYLEYERTIKLIRKISL
jgi:tetratricopeptide (TPR) repeat protein